MNRNSVLSRFDYADLLIKLVFGEADDLLASCVKRAYLDICRTLRGLSKLANRDQIVAQSSRYLRQRLLDIASGYVELEDQVHFDRWHQTTCHRLSGIFDERGYEALHLGQAQKWVNLSLKYVHVMGSRRLPGFEALYPFCHLPLDNALVEKLAPYGFPPLSCPWNHLDDYKQYLERQQWVRDDFVFSPLDIEFFVTLGREPALPE